MDPLSAFSLAAGILQLIDFTTKLASKSYELHKSTAGVLADHESLEAATLRLTSLVEAVESSDQTTTLTSSAASTAQSALQNVITECLAIAKEMNEALARLQTRHDSKYENARVALRAVFKQKKLDELEQKLARCRQEMLLNFIVIIQSDLGSLGRQLEAIRGDNANSHQHTQNELKVAVDKIINAISTRNNNDVDLEQITRGLQQINVSSAAEQAFLDDLYLPILESRERQIVDAASSTFEWMFETNDEVVSLEGNVHKRDAGFIEWLSAGDGVFWITGKPGSGKSTLMKFIAQDQRTDSALKEWAGQSELVTASAYFWISGDPMQKCLLGLWRSLFYHILTKQRTLIRSLFPWRWRKYESGGRNVEQWREDEFLDALKKLPSVMNHTCRFCFFVDGLDEYDGDHRKMIALLHELVKNQNLKMCVSSRPWTVFDSCFAKSPTVRIHEWTRSDIGMFITQQLKDHPTWCEMAALAPVEARDLQHHIMSSSDGVFLWTYLVIRELKASLDDGTTMEELRIQLNNIPTDLETFFKRMLDNIPLPYQSQAKAFLMLKLKIGSRLHAWMLSYADRSDPNFGELSAVTPIPVAKLLLRRRLLMRRIHSHCQDLLEIQPLQTYTDTDAIRIALMDPIDSIVIFSHRSVHDFLYSTWGLENHTEQEVDQWIWQAVLAEAKIVPFDEIQDLGPSSFLTSLLERLLEHGLREPSIAVLEEIRKVVESGAQKLANFWPLAFPVDQSQGRFLDWAVVRGYSRYVERKLYESGPIAGQDLIVTLLPAIGGRILTEMVGEDPSTWTREYVSCHELELLGQYSLDMYEKYTDPYYWLFEQSCFLDTYTAEVAAFRKERSGKQELYKIYRWVDFEALPLIGAQP